MDTKNYTFKNILPKATGLGVFLALGALFVSCEDEMFDDPTGEMKMFTPLSLSVSNLENSSEISWDAALFTSEVDETYTAQVSEDSLFENSEDIILTKETDSTGVVFYSDEVSVRQKYFVRVKTNAETDDLASNWSTSTSFRIVGTQFLQKVYDPNVNATTAVIKWNVTEGVTTIQVQEYTQEEDEDAVLIGDPISYDISSTEAAEGSKTITDLKPDTRYNVDLYSGNTSVGYGSFKTKTITEFTIMVSEGEDLVTIVNSAEDGAVIGLNPGNYEATENFLLDGKSITLQGTTNNPSDTKISFKEFQLNDTGAGITLKNLELDGATIGANYLINLTSTGGEPADFANVSIENCEVYGVGTSAFRANRGPTGGYTMESFSINYSIFHDFSISNYAFLHLEELIFENVSLKNSTFYEISDLFMRYRANFSDPAPAQTPNITIDNCTINSIGYAQSYTLIDANTVDVNLTVQNSIIANIPRVDGELGSTDLYRLNGQNSSIIMSYNNLYNLTTGGDDAQPITFPEVATNAINNNFEIELDWDNQTTNFTLPSGSALQTASSSGGPIGDPRWWY
ncbi:DUF4957 domain-containing protein [Zunongwangia sp. HGR-M22]|uniref:DUF4957 domain-containing protein n=1 Tax=Zunongwangia sp. HGR-M22 TaxID=3015168 RepID=UPI0022DD9AE0|nr:DUF4957 domain-containing protein [Zunongwangia sp. HGR-M22]WBL24722.1 DUF4957 domain-containing protein [Zunongwangia sp. HGR-M22]